MKLKALLPIRGKDKQGFGHYGAPRGKRVHRGVDYACYPGTTIYPVKLGEVTRLGKPYSAHLQYDYVQVTDVDGNDWRYFYLDPMVSLRQLVNFDTPLGKVQELHYEGITQHCHLEVRKGKEYFNPEDMM